MVQNIDHNNNNYEMQLNRNKNICTYRLPSLIVICIVYIYFSMCDQEGLERIFDLFLRFQ